MILLKNGVLGTTKTESGPCACDLIEIKVIKIKKKFNVIDFLQFIDYLIFNR
jgi:hypothetical protein